MSALAELRHRRATLLLSFAAFASAASARLCDPMLPELAHSFGSTATATAQVVSGFSVSYGLLQAFYGPLGDRLGKYRLIGLATLVCTLTTLLAVLATSLNALVLARMLTGATAAGIIPLSMAWIGDTVAYEERQATLARFLSGQVLGMVGGQLLGGVFSDTLGWRWAFGSLGLMYALVGALVLREARRNPVTQAPPASAASRAGLWAQVRLVLAEPWARVILGVVFVEGVLVFGAMAFVPSYIHHRFGLSLTVAGAMMAFFGAGGLSYMVGARHFVRVLGESGLALAGGLCLSLAWVVLLWSPAWGWAAPSAFLAGLGYYMLHNTLQTNATQMAPAVRGTAVALFASSFFLGQGLGVGLSSMAIPAVGQAGPFVASASLLPLLALLFSWLLRQRRSANV